MTDMQETAGARLSLHADVRAYTGVHAPAGGAVLCIK